MFVLRLIFNVLIMTCLFFPTIGCSFKNRHPVPLDIDEKLSLEAAPDHARTSWEKNKGVDHLFQKDFIQSFFDEPQGYFFKDETEPRLYSGLAISGGGISGAFGAGILCGWSKNGTRPRFKIVTGISTGALIAPYAFLGADYDAKLQKVYTSVSSKDIFKVKNLFTMVSESLVDSSPLKKMIDNEVDQAMLDDIARAHENGQRLYIGTTDLDAQKFVVWNMGAIAKYDHPGALALFRQVILASASIPGVFPPVYIKVRAGDETYDEMHVDGGVVNQLFFYELLLDVQSAANQFYKGDESGQIGHLFVIRNGKITREPMPTSPKTIAIARRALSTMIKYAAANDIFRVYSRGKKDNLDFSYIDIPQSYTPESSDSIDPQEMNRLFHLGFETASQKDFWLKEPDVFQ